MKPILIHTNIIHGYLQGIPQVVKMLQAQKPCNLRLSSITAMEMSYAATLMKEPHMSVVLKGLYASVTVLPFDRKASELAAEYLVLSKRSGNELSIADAEIAGHASALNASLATAMPYFFPIPKLKMLLWN